MKLFIKAIIVAVLIFIGANSAMAGIYNNSGTTAEDSICFVGMNISADGRRALAVTAASDSLYVLVFYPGGTLAFRDSCLMNDSKVTIAAFEDQAAVSGFSYKNSVANVDGAGLNGTYKVLWAIRDIDSANTTFGTAEAQVYTTANLSDRLDSSIVDGSSFAGLDNAIDASVIAADAITTSEIATGAIDDDAVADGAIDLGGELDSAGLGASGWGHGTRTLTSLGTGSGLTAIPWNSAWDAEVESEVVDGLTAQDVMLAGDSSTFADHVWTHGTRTLTSLGTGSGLTAIPWNAAWDAEVESEVVDGITAQDVMLAGDSSTFADHIWTHGIRTLTSVPGSGDSTITQARLDSLIKLTQAVAGKTGLPPNAVVRFVTKQGDDANDGSSWAKAHLTINDALNNGPADSLVPFYVFVGPGLYSACTVKTSSTHLIGSGMNSTIVSAASGFAILVDKDATITTDRTFGNEIAHMSAFVESQATSSQPLTLRRADSIYVHDCGFSGGHVGADFGGFGSSTHASDGVIFYNNILRYQDHDGIFAANSEGVVIHGNFIIMDSLMSGGDLTGADGIAIGRRAIVAENYIACSTGFNVAGAPGNAISEITNGTWKNYVMGNTLAMPVEDRANYNTFIRRKAGKYSKFADNRTSQVMPWSVTPNSSAFTYDSSGIDAFDGKVALDTLREFTEVVRDTFSTQDWSSTAVSACNGSGIVSCTLDVRNSAGGLGGVSITISNTSNAELYSDVSDANGFVYFNLDASTTYRIKAGGLPGSVHDSLPYQTLGILAVTNKRDTVPMTTASIPSPSSANLTRIYTYEDDGSGGRLAGVRLHAVLLLPSDSMSATKIAFDTATGVAYGANTEVVDTGTVTNANGYAHIDLTRNDYISPFGTRWQVWAEYKKQVRWSVILNITSSTSQCIQAVLGIGSCP